VDLCSVQVELVCEWNNTAAVIDCDAYVTVPVRHELLLSTRATCSFLSASVVRPPNTWSSHTHARRCPALHWLDSCVVVHAVHYDFISLYSLSCSSASASSYSASPSASGLSSAGMEAAHPAKGSLLAVGIETAHTLRARLGQKSAANISRGD
jgi:hypothetical protein